MIHILPSELPPGLDALLEEGEGDQDVGEGLGELLLPLLLLLGLTELPLLLLELGELLLLLPLLLEDVPCTHDVAHGQLRLQDACMQVLAAQAFQRAEHKRGMSGELACQGRDAHRAADAGVAELLGALAMESSTVSPVTEVTRMGMGKLLCQGPAVL
jgi:hypothetical protein